ncbi:MAG: RIP metalloprotease RseP [Flavobacteriaceae bacterium]
MSPFAIKALQFLASMSLLIILHELGHFIPARLFKIRVEKFFLFFDVKFALFKKKIGETVYGIGWLPLGGYVKISGMIDESMDTEQMAQPMQPWEFRSKPAWQRLIVMLGGVTVNLVLGFLIYIMIMFVWGKNIFSNTDLPAGFKPTPSFVDLGFQNGDQILKVDGKSLDNVMEVNQQLFLRSVASIEVQHTDGNREVIQIPEDIGHQMFRSGEMFPLMPLIPARIDSIVPLSNAAVGGLRPGDLVLEINDRTILDRTALIKTLEENNTSTTRFKIQRGTQIEYLNVTPKGDGTFGIFTLYPDLAYRNQSLSLSESITEGIEHGYWILHDYVAQFQYIFTSKGASQLGGFGTIGNLFPGQWNWRGFWYTTALISIILAFMNVLPIPALDGGHVMFLLYEMITGRSPHQKVLEYAQMFGFLLLLSLVIYANGNDLYRLITGG